MHTPWLIAGAMETATFAWSIAAQLAPTLRPGQVVVVDHLRAHKADSIRHAIAARGCELLFLPPYSPDFTPIEPAFSKIKAVLRGLGARSKETLQGDAPRRRSKETLQGDAPRRRSKETLQEAVRLAIEAITRHDAVAWFAHAGYTLPAQAT